MARRIVSACSGAVAKFENKMSAVATKRVQRVPKHAKSKGEVSSFQSTGAPEHTRHTNHPAWSVVWEGEMDNFEGDAKPVLIVLTEKKAYLNPSLPPLSSFLLLAMRCHLLSCRVERSSPWQKRTSVSIAQGYVLSQKELQYSQRERGRERGGREGGGEWREGGGRILTISPFWMKSDLHVSSFLSGSPSFLNPSLWILSDMHQESCTECLSSSPA